jgi:hypothetical protein
VFITAFSIWVSVPHLLYIARAAAETAALSADVNEVAALQVSPEFIKIKRASASVFIVLIIL